jgi:hypothetical protein
MTSEDLRSELDKEPFVPIRLHLVSGNSVEIRTARDATLLQNAVLVLHALDPRFEEAGYDVISLRNIERIEQIRSALRQIK